MCKCNVIVNMAISSMLYKCLQVDSTLSASTPDLKKSWCLLMEASVKEIDSFLWRSFQDQSYQMITQHIDQSAAIKQSVTGRAEQQYILCNVLTGVSTCQASQVPTALRVSSLAQSAASGSHTQIITTGAPRTCLNVSLNLSEVAPTLSVTPTRGLSVIVSVGFFRLWTLNALNTVHCGTKFRVIADDTEMVQTFDFKLCELLFHVDRVY